MKVGWSALSLRFLCLALCVLGALPLSATETLRVLSWPGYTSPEIVRNFEQQFDARVELTEVNTDDVLWEKASANGGQDFDVVAVNTAELQRLIQGGLAVPLALEAIPNTRQQLRRFRDLAAIPGLVYGDKTYALPFTYSEMGLIYNRKLVKQAPTSMAALWDLQYRGRILLYEGSAHNFSLTALLAGEKNPFRLSESAFRNVVQRLIALRANRPLLYSSPEEAVRQFRRKPVALAFGNYGTQQLKALQAAGEDVGYVLPQEGALAWLDCWAILKGGSKSPLASAWINHMLTREVGQHLVQQQGLPNTLENPPGMRDADKLIWLQPVENPERRSEYWSRILSGYRKGMF